MKKIKFLLACLFISLLFTNTLAAEVPETGSKEKSIKEEWEEATPIPLEPEAGSKEKSLNEYYSGLLNSYKETHLEIIAKLEHAKKNVPEIKRLLNETNRIDKLLAKKMDEFLAKNINNPEQYNNVYDKYAEKYSRLFNIFGVARLTIAEHFPEFNIDKYPQKLDTVLKDTIFLYRDTLTCFDNNAYSGTKNCESFRKFCVNYGSDNGNMYYYELTEDLGLKEIDVSEGDQRLLESKGTDIHKDIKTYLEHSYQFCRLLAMTASPFSPRRITKNNAGFSLIKNFYGSVSPFPTSFKNTCIDNKPGEYTVSRLYDLKEQYADEWIFKEFSKQYEKWQSECEKAAQQICKESCVIKDKVILAYETVSCTIREVTKEDVENDIALIDSHANKLKHSTLLDTIDICQQAYDNGFFWGFKKPELSEKCKEEKKTKTKSKPVK